MHIQNATDHPMPIQTRVRAGPPLPPHLLEERNRAFLERVEAEDRAFLLNHPPPLGKKPMAGEDPASSQGYFEHDTPAPVSATHKRTVPAPTREAPDDIDAVLEKAFHANHAPAPGRAHGAQEPRLSSPDPRHDLAAPLPLAAARSPTVRQTPKHFTEYLHTELGSEMTGGLSPASSASPGAWCPDPMNAGFTHPFEPEASNAWQHGAAVGWNAGWPMVEWGYTAAFANATEAGWPRFDPAPSHAFPPWGMHAGWPMVDWGHAAAFPNGMDAGWPRFDLGPSQAFPRWNVVSGPNAGWPAPLQTPCAHCSAVQYHALLAGQAMAPSFGAPLLPGHYTAFLARANAAAAAGYAPPTQARMAL